jgi:AcrR family transcriptional regulator
LEIKRLTDAGNFASICSFFKLAFPKPMSSVKASALKPRKPARQQRSQATIEAILEAAARILAKDSLAGLNTNRVAEVAGISIGSLYQYFPNKEALIAALLLRAHVAQAEGLKAMASSLRGQPLPVAVRALVKLAMRGQWEQPMLAAALDHEERRLPVEKLLRASHQAIDESLLELLQEHRKAIAPGDLRVIARDVVDIAKALIEKDADGRSEVPAGLEDRIYRAVMGYLVTPTTPTATASRR